MKPHTNLWKLPTKLALTVIVAMATLTHAHAEMRIASVMDYVTQPLVMLVPDYLAKNVESKPLNTNVTFIAKINGNYYSASGKEIENHATENNLRIIPSWTSTERKYYTGIITMDEYIYQLKQPWGRAGWIFMDENGDLYVDMDRF